VPYPAIAPGPAAAPTSAVVSSTVKVVWNVVIEATAPTRRISANSVQRKRADPSSTMLRPKTR